MGASGKVDGTGAALATIGAGGIMSAAEAAGAPLSVPVPSTFPLAPISAPSG